MARERLGRAAAGLKTREELLAALHPPEASEEASAGEPEEVAAVVTRDFFVARH
jgi:hypothetical protein